MTESSNDARTRVLQATNIVELIGQTVKLKRRGNKYVGLCPFHTEKTPSFHVDPAKQFFHCFGCKAGSNAIDFVMRRDRLEFMEALQLLARLANIELPRFGVSKQNTSERQVLLDAHSAACGLFEKMIAHPEIGEPARQYLEKRGFAAEALKRFQVGLAMDSWDALLKSQAMKKFTPQHLASAGLVKSREGGEGFYDTFRNRIIFPIRDEQGRIIAFGGRVMPGSQDPAKYLNSPETPLFSKSRCIYGLDFAKQKIVETKTVAIVEGYTDVVMAHQYGATNVVSVLGTAMTEQHVSILRRFADRIVLLFDPDTAGDLAVDRAVELLLSQQVEITVASMPDGVDPDEYLMKHGLESFEKLLAGAQDVLSYKWRQLLKNFGSKDDLTSQQKAIEQYLELLASARGSGPVDPLRWGAILARVSRLTEIPAAELNRRFKPKRKSAEWQAAPVKIERTVLNAQDRAERWLLGGVLVEPSRWPAVQQAVQPNDFSDEQRRKLAETIWTHHRDEGEAAMNELLGQLEDDEIRELAVAVVDEIDALGNLDQAMDDAILHMRELRKRQDENRLTADLKRESGSAGSAEDDIEMLRQLQEKARRPDIRRTSS